MIAIRLRRTTALAIALFAPSLFGQSVASTERGIVVAHDRTVELYARNGRDLLWRGEGVGTPGAIAASDSRIAVLDPLQNEVRILDLADGRGSTLKTGETPLACTFMGNDLYVLERDARAVERIRSDGSRTSISLGADPSFLRAANGKLYVYERNEGLLQEINTKPFAAGRRLQLSAGGSDFKADGKNGYLIEPRSGKVRMISLETMQVTGSVDVGAVPIEIAAATHGTALSARTLAVADPAARKVWLIEGSQSVGEAVARGFLRGLIGLGLSGGGSSEFPTGVDRIVASGPQWLAYDSSSRTLYRFRRRKSSVLAKNVAPRGFTVTSDGVYLWDDAVRRLQRLPTDG